jgi:hypothetical protein
LSYTPIGRFYSEPFSPRHALSLLFPVLEGGGQNLTNGVQKSRIHAALSGWGDQFARNRDFRLR